MFTLVGSPKRENVQKLLISCNISLLEISPIFYFTQRKPHLPSLPSLSSPSISPPPPPSTPHHQSRPHTPNPTPISVPNRQLNLSRPLPRIPALKRAKPLRKSHKRIRGLGQRLALSDTNPIPAAKGHELPRAGLDGVPAVGVEGFDVGAEDGGVAVEGVEVCEEAGARGDVDGVVVEGAAAGGEGGVAEGDAGVLGEDGVDSEG